MEKREPRSLAIHKKKCCTPKRKVLKKKRANHPFLYSRRNGSETRPAVVLWKGDITWGGGLQERGDANIVDSLLIRGIVGEKGVRKGRLPYSARSFEHSDEKRVEPRSTVVSIQTSEERGGRGAWKRFNVGNVTRGRRCVSWWKWRPRGKIRKGATGIKKANTHRGKKRKERGESGSRNGTAESFFGEYLGLPTTSNIQIGKEEGNYI